jgi:SWI/SNF-related matrix-associated actin-dependent regulator 1 of chromatin subfamily A
MCESPIATNWVHYVRRYCAGRQFNRKGTKQKYWVTSGASNLDELREYASDVMLRRTKKDSIDLPQKTIKPVYLPLEYSTSYNAYIAEYEQWIEDMAAMGEKPSVTDHLTKLIKVRQLLSNDKIEHTIKLAEDLIENEHKVIIFSCFTQTINAIHEHFGKASVLIDGSVSKEKRQLAVDRFQTDAKIKVFCGNIVAAGVGLTLTEGTIVIFNDLDWTPANHAQAEDRAHRIGQENDVHIIYPLFDETLDTIMFDTLRRKMKIITQVMGDSMMEDNVSVGREVINGLMKT